MVLCSPMQSDPLQRLGSISLWLQCQSIDVLLGGYNSESFVEDQKKIHTIIHRECILEQGWIIIKV